MDGGTLPYEEPGVGDPYGVTGAPIDVADDPAPDVIAGVRSISTIGIFLSGAIFDTNWSLLFPRLALDSEEGAFQVGGFRVG